MQSGPEQLRHWLKRREFTNEEAAKYMGIDASVMTKLANGSRNAGLKIAVVIERHTGIPVEAWLSEDADELVAATPADARNRKKDK